MTADMAAVAPIADFVDRVPDVADRIVDTDLDAAAAVGVANQSVGFGIAGALGDRQLLDSLAV